MFKYILVALLFSGAAQAETMKSYFDNFSSSKGAFGPNMMQGRSRRRTYNNWNASGQPGFIFQAAFRSEIARKLVEEHGVYTGNLFATNYYELKAEFLLGDKNADNLSKGDTIDKLVSVSISNPAVFQRAQQMVQNWNLERLYILKNPSSRLAHGFTARGIGGAEFEQKYGQLFVSYYIEAANSNKDLMTLVTLVDSSSLVSSSNFTKIRNKATSLYETYKPGGSKGHLIDKGNLRKLKDIRDSIHNQLTPEVVVVIDAYMARTKSSMGHAELNKIKALIKSYFARGVADINHIAKKGKIKVEGLKAINTKSPKLENLWTYAEELVANRKNMMTSNVKLKDKYIHLAYTSVAASFLFDKTRRYISKNSINGTNINALTEILIKLLYLQGFVGEESFVLSQGQALSDFDTYEAMYDGLLDSVLNHVKVSYSPYADKWKQVDDKMSIVDDSIRSSAIGLFNHILDKMD